LFAALFLSIVYTAIDVCISSSLFFLLSSSCRVFYMLSLHVALPISVKDAARICLRPSVTLYACCLPFIPAAAHAASYCCYFSVSDRKSTRLNSSHVSISYAVFCLKKKMYLDFLL